jgi:protein-disulfide isomerase
MSKTINSKTKILLFISKSSIYFQTTMEEFQKLLEILEEIQPFTSEIIDVNEQPEMAEKYKIDALPTMIIGDKRFIGQPHVEQVMEVVTKDREL